MKKPLMTPTALATSELPWWQKGIVYQIYPRSYQDSNGDGVGDLPGITQRLDYIKSLNVDAIWLSPFYPSPMHDWGYDVSNYTDIDPLFGVMSDFDRLLAEIHKRDMKLIIDFVPDYTSDEHPWFVESRGSRTNPKRDWYIWRDSAPDGGPPNNWQSVFGGSAWKLDEKTGQYYLHQFYPPQPDLNLRNPKVLHALFDVMRFWLAKGVDGFRCDAVNQWLEDDQFRDEPMPAWRGTFDDNITHIYTSNQPGNHDIIRQMRAVLDPYDGRVMIGETYLPNTELVKYYGAHNNEFQLPFNFQLIATPWEARTVRTMVDEYEGVLPTGAWPNWVWGNHDNGRVASRIGPSNARVANMLLLTLRGTPTTYYGEEIGMEDVPIPGELRKDPVGRDPERTPMQWDSSPNAGFTYEATSPWLPVAEDYAERNVAQQETDPASMLNLYRALTSLRRTEPALYAGNYTSLDSGKSGVFAYLRTAPDSDRFLVVLNFTAQEYTVNLSQVGQTATIAVATDMKRQGLVNLVSVGIGSNEGLVMRLK